MNASPEQLDVVVRSRDGGGSAIREEELDLALRRLLRARFKLGMFDPPDRVPYANLPFSVNESPEHQALALEALGRPKQAEQALARAVAAARPQGYQRVFLDLGGALCGLLLRALPPAGEGYLRDLIDAFRARREARGGGPAGAAPAGALDALTGRELEQVDQRPPQGRRVEPAE